MTYPSLRQSENVHTTYPGGEHPQNQAFFWIIWPPVMNDEDI